MTLTHAARTILEKAAIDNGFSLDEGMSGEWLIFRAHAAPARLCLTSGPGWYGIGTDHAAALDEAAAPLTPLETAPAGFKAVRVESTTTLGTLAGALWRLARALPEAPLRAYQQRLATPELATETERLRKERIGQDVFRAALMDFWNGACAVTGISHPRLLRASHIIPWAECNNDAERLNVHNGLLLAAHLDAAFDAHLISFDASGEIVLSSCLSSEDATRLGITTKLRLRAMHAETARRLALHRVRTPERNS